MRRAALTLMLAATVAGCGGQSPQKTSAELAPVSVTTVPARWEELPENLELAGHFQAIREATLSTRLSGRITSLVLEEGDRVQSGEVVARVDLADVEARIEQARTGQVAAAAATRRTEAGVASARAQIGQSEAQLEAVTRQLTEAEAQLRMARKDHERNAFLSREGAVAQEVADRSETQLRVSEARAAQLRAGISQARAAVSRARAGLQETRTAIDSSRAGEAVAAADVGVAATNLDYGVLRAPFAGVVTQKLAQVGEMAGPGQPLLKIQDVHQLRLEVAVPEDLLGRLRLGQSLPIAVDALGGTVTGVVRQLVPSSDPKSHSFTAKLRISNPGNRLIPGMYGRLSLSKGIKKRLVLPAATLVRHGQLESVFLARDGHAELRLVKTRPLDKQRMEVLTGLEGDEAVILSPPAGLAQGAPVSAR